jgi:hypothetical protein
VTRELVAIQRAYDRHERHMPDDPGQYSHEAIGALLAECRLLRRALREELGHRFRRAPMDYREMADYVASEYGISYWPQDDD